MEVKYSLILIPVPQGKELRKTQSLCYLGCFSAHVPPELQYMLLWIGEVIPSISLSPMFEY